jgi:hypothetical protein
MKQEEMESDSFSLNVLRAKTLVAAASASNSPHSVASITAHAYLFVKEADLSLWKACHEPADLLSLFNHTGSIAFIQ